MGNLVVTYPDGRRETYAYEQLLDLDPYSCFYQNPPWNQKILHEWKKQNCVLFCHCRPERPIRIGFRSLSRARLTLVSEPNVEHARTCFKFQKHIDAPAHKVETRPGVVHTTITDAEGTREVVRVTLADDFFKEEEEDADGEGGAGAQETIAAGRAESPRYVKRVGEGGVVHRQAHAALGELVFEWYLKGRERALSYAQKKGYSEVTREGVLNGMVAALMRKDVDLRGAQRKLSDIAFIPSFVREPQYPPYKLIVGVVIEQEKVEDGQIWTLQGSRKKGQTWPFTWKVHVRSMHLPGHKNVGRLAAIKTVFRNGELISVQRVFDTILTKVGGLWVDSGHEDRLYDELRPLCQGRATMEKPYHPSAEWAGYQPDFVLRAGGQTCVIEVWGMMSQDEYREHAFVKQEVYREHERHGEFRFLEWDVEREQEQGLRRLLHDVTQWLDTVAPPKATFTPPSTDVETMNDTSQVESEPSDVKASVTIPVPPQPTTVDSSETVAPVSEDSYVPVPPIVLERPRESPTKPHAYPVRRLRRRGMQGLIQRLRRWLPERRK